MSRENEENHIANVRDVETRISEGKEEFVRVKTGEIIEVDEIDKRLNSQKNFWKMYLMDYMAVLGIIDSKQLDIFIYIAQNTNPSNNLFIGTYKKISEAVNVSQPTISTIMKKLQANKFIKKVQNGVWMVSPNVVMKGNENKRQILLSYYLDESDKLGSSNGKVGELKVTRAQREAIPKIDESLEKMKKGNDLIE